MDDDQTVLPSYVDAIIKTFEDYPEYTAIGGRMFPFGEDGREIKCTSRYLNPFCKSDLGDVAKEYPKKVSLSNPTMYFPSGGAITIKKEFFEQYGDYGEPYFECSLTEDIYISSKLRQNNKKILYAPAVVIYHHIPKERYEYNYLMKSGYGGGVAQARQARSSLINRMLKFLFATGVGVFYFVTFRPTKGRYLIGFQYHWLKGYIKGMAQAK